jgi:hypothetical protein
VATLTLSLTSTPVTGARNYSLSDADVDRWIAALRIVFGMPSQFTGGQVLARWADEVVEHAKQQTRQVERDAATAAAATGVVDIIIT